MKHLLQKTIALKALLLVGLLVNAVSGAWAEDVTSTLTFAAKCNGSGIADDGVTWTVSSDGTESNYESTRGIHYGTNSAQVQYIKLSTSEIEGTITKVVVNASTASGVSATVGVSVGDEAFGGAAKTLSSTATDYTFEGSAEGEIIVTVTKPSQAAKALFVKSVAVTYTTGGGSTPIKEDCDLALTDAPIALTFDMYNNSTAQYISYTTSSTGEITAESNAAVSCYADPETKTISVTPFASTNGKPLVITLNQAADENYKAGSVTFTVTVTDSTPEDPSKVTIWSEDFSSFSASDVPTKGTNATYTCTNGGSDTKIYEEARAGGTSPELLVSKNNGVFSVVITDLKGCDGEMSLSFITNRTDLVVTIKPDKSWGTTTSGTIKSGTTSTLTFDIPSGTKKLTIDFSMTNSSNARLDDIVLIGKSDGKEDNGLSFSSETASAVIGGESSIFPTLTNPNDLAVTYSSSDEKVAVINEEGVITLVAAGETTITATFAGNDDYKAGSASYVLTVTAANQVATPVIAFGATTFFESTTATITCATEGATILYSTDNGENWQTYTDVLTLTETTTLVAKATKEGATDSQVSEAVTASKYSVLEGLAGMAANATSKSQTSYVKLSNAQVTARAQSGNGGEMQDATTGVLLYNSSFVAGKLYNGIFSVTYVLYQGNPEITAIEVVEGEGTITDASSEVEPALVTLQELVENFSTYLHKKIIIVGATVTTALENKGATIKQNGVEMALRENNSTSVITKLTKDAEVNVVGYPAIYSSKQQIYIYSDDDISAIVDQRADSKLALGALNSTTLNVGDKIQLNYTSDSNGDITWSTSNGNVLTVDQQGNVEAVAVGEATITVAQSETESYKAGEASIKLTVVDPNQGQYLWLLSEASYSSASADQVTWTSDYATMVIEKANAGTNANNYLGGDANKRTSTRFYADQVLTITRVEGYRIASILFQATTNGYATTFKNSTWTNAAEVVISGENAVTITPTDGMEAIVATVGGTCGFDKVLVTYVKTDEVVKPVPSLAFVDAANMPITKIELVKDDTFTATLSTDLSSTDEILISIQPEGIVSYDNNIITALDAGEATITATFAGNDSYKPASAQLKVVVSNPAEPVDICEINGINPTSLTINETAQFTLDATFVEGLTLGVDYEILWESSDPTILDVHSNGLAVANGVGTAEVTVKVKEIVKNEADKRFIDMEKTFTVTVYGPATQVQGALIAKLADGTYRAVTNDATTKKNWLVGREVTVINGKVLASENDSDISWTITTRGDVTTFQDLDGKFISAPTSGNNLGLADAASESTQWTVDGDSWTKLQGENQKTILWNNANQGFRYYASSNIDNSGYSSAITYSEIVPGCTRTLSNTWGTVCFSRQVLVENTVNARFYWVAGKVLNEAGEPVKLILREEDYALKTGYPFIVEAIDPTAPVIMLFEEGELVERALNMNGLYGTHTETEVPEGAYILNGGQFVKCGTGCSVAADRAYLKMEEVPEYEGDEAGVKVFNLGGEDGISSLDAAAEGAVIYDLSGRRVSKTAKGLYIINGKKVSVK